MALDTDQKRGSAIGLTLPWRQWFSKPAADLATTDHLALLKLCSAIAPAVPSIIIPPIIAHAIDFGYTRSSTVAIDFTKEHAVDF